MKKLLQIVFICFCLMVFTTAKAQNYTSVNIGHQTWMTENLDVFTFRNGDSIPQVISEVEWALAAEEGKPAWCYYDNDAANGTRYGKLYNWFAVNDPRGLAPAGWHIPTHKEWKEFTEYVGGKKVVCAMLKSTEGWLHEGNGTNQFGFSALPGGRRSAFAQDVFIFRGMGLWGYWWTSTPYLFKKFAFSRSLHANGTFQWLYWEKGDGMSVRCIKDNISDTQIR